MEELRPHIDAALVQGLVAEQFPHLADQAVVPLSTDGTDHEIFRLGPQLAVRLPARESAARQVTREQQWLPRLAPGLPLPIPQPLHAGAPAADYPWPWSICPWLEGTPAGEAAGLNLALAAEDLGRFLIALRGLDADGGPRAGRSNHGRGVPLAHLDARVRADVATLGAEIDAGRLLAIWDQALAARTREGPGAWLHGDLHPANLLVRDGRMAAVLDFGLLGVGDPAVDLIVAWNLLDAPARRVFRDTAEADPAMWARGKGWAVYTAVIVLAFYRDTNPSLCRMAWRTVAELSAETD